ncbi:F0F1 ATP synthase subunit B [soil metagenome]
MAEETTATTEAHGGAEMSYFNPASPEFWVYAGLTIFILLAIFVAKAPKKITDSLDARIAETKRTLDEARAIRTEAEALLATAKAQTQASAGDASAIIAHAEAEAKNLLAEAEAHAVDLTARRAKMAEDKIAAAERGAIADVRAKAASAAASVAAQVIAQTHDAAADHGLVDGAISRLN